MEELFQFVKASRPYKNYDNEIKIELNDYSLLKSDDDQVICMLPVELLFTERGDSPKIKKMELGEKWKEHNKIWENLEIVRLSPHRELFMFFKGLADSPKKYLDWYHTIFSSRNAYPPFNDMSIIEQKYKEYYFQSEKINEGMSFFIQAPCEAEWNDKGYFNLTDGHHRCVFLYCMGIRRVPVKVKKEDYEKYLNRQAAEKCLKMIQEQNRKEFYQPILNPYFLDKIVYRDTCYKTRLDIILEYFDTFRFKNLKVLDIGANIGYYSHAFSRMGAQVIGLEPDKMHCDLAKTIGELLYSTAHFEQVTFEVYETEDEFDACMMLTVLYDIFHDAVKRDAFINKINDFVKQFIIWESGSLESAKDEKACILEHTKFKYYHKLGNTYATGKIREIGIFYSNPDWHVPNVYS